MIFLSVTTAVLKMITIAENSLKMEPKEEKVVEEAQPEAATQNAAEESAEPTENKELQVEEPNPTTDTPKASLENAATLSPSRACIFGCLGSDCF